MGKTKRKLHTVYLDPDKHELFMQLSRETRIAQAVLLREAVDDLLMGCVSPAKQIEGLM